MQRNSESTMYKTHEFNMALSENVRPEELLGFLKNFKKSICGTGATNVAIHINCLHTILCGEKLR